MAIPQWMACAPVLKIGNWGGRRESNPQPSEPQSGALPVELLPPESFDYNKLEEAISSA